MKQIRLSFKRFIKNLLPKDVIPFDDKGTDTELHCYKLFGKYVKVTQYVKPIQPNDEQCEYLGII